MEKSYLYFLLGLWLIVPAQAQVNVDSLREVAGDESLPDSSRFLAYQSLSFHYTSKIPDSAMHFAGQWYALAERKQDQGAMADALLIQGITHGRKGEYDRSLEVLGESLGIYDRLDQQAGQARTLNNLGSTYYYLGEYPQAIHHFQRSLTISQSLGNQAAMASSLNGMGNVSYSQGEFSQALTYYGESLGIREALKDQPGIAQALANMAMIYQSQGEYAQALVAIERSLTIDEASGSKFGVARSLSMIGGLHHKQGDYSQAIDCYQRSLEIGEAIEDQLGNSATWFNLGLVHRDLGDYAQALVNFKQSLTISEEVADPLGIIDAWNSIGSIYEEQDNFEAALRAYERNLALSDSLGYQLGVASALSSLGNIYSEQGDNEQALIHYQRALDIREAVGDQPGATITLNNIGAFYKKLGEYDQALVYLQRSLELSQQLGDVSLAASALGNMGTVYLLQKQFAQARTYGEKALPIARGVKNLDVLQEIYQLLYRAYKATGQATQALAMHELYIQMRDSLNSEENQRATIRFEYQRKALADSLANEQEKALAQVEYENQLGQQRLQLGFAGGAGLLLAILAGVLYRNSRRRRQTNQLLSHQNEQIEAKSQQNELLLKEIHHRVKNNLQTISSLLYLQSAHIKDAEVKQAVAAGQHRVESMALIHQKLYQRDNLAGIEMKDYLSHLSESLLNTLDYDPERIALRLDMEELELDVDTAVPLGLIVNELITNALKYAFPEGRSGRITVSLQRTSAGLELHVADDGVGAANELSGTSFGSQLINLLTQQLGGKIEQGQEAGYCTRVVV